MILALMRLEGAALSAPDIWDTRSAGSGQAARVPPTYAHFNCAR